MPLIIITGTPSSGKTKRSKELQKYFQEIGKDVCIVSENEEIKKAGFDKNDFYKNSQKEKQIRDKLKSEVLRLIGPKSLVILDGSNYIKGYRYELYCASKANKCTQCTIQCMINFEKAYEFNTQRENEQDKYSKEVFDALCMRYEEPDSKNRWDSPLFVVQTDETLQFDAISQCLFDKKPPPPNMSTQNMPLNDTIVYELERITNEFTNHLITAKKIGTTEVKVPGHPDMSINISNASISQIHMLRRQFIIYSKSHIPEVNKILILFIHFLKTNLANS